jgi:gliding motility-associated-like protein
MFKRISFLFPMLLILIVNCQLSINNCSAQTTFRLSYDIAQFDLTGGMVQSPAGDYVIAGTNASFIPLYGNVIKMDANANFQWAKSFTGGVATDFSDIKNISTGGFIISGSSSSGGAILIKLDNNGNIVWANRYQCPDIPSGNDSEESAYAVTETSDGGFLVGGSVSYFWDGSSSSTVDTSSAFGFKVNAAGTLQWSRVWTIATANPDEHYINDVVESADGYFFVGESSEGSGTANDDGDYPRNALLIKTDLNGNLQYLRRWGTGNTSSQGINSAIRLTGGANAGKILLGGYDDANAFLITCEGTGSTPTMGAFNRRINAGFLSTFVIQDIMESSDGNFSAIGMNVQFASFYSAVLKVNSSSGALIFGKGYTPVGPLAAILPEGGLASDGGYFMSMTDQQVTGFNYHVVKTDNQGNMGTGSTGSSCGVTSLNPGTQAYSVTLTTPTYNTYTTASASPFSPVVNNLSPAPIMDCSNIPCTAPPNPTSSSSTTICQGQSATINASGSGSVTYNVWTQSTGGTNLGSTPLSVSPSSTTTYYVEALNEATACPSAARTAVTITVIPTQNPAWTSPGTVCLAGSAINLSSTVTGTTGGTFTGTGVSSNTFTPSTAGAGTHTITYSVGASPCTVTEQHTITVEPTVTATWNAPANVCQGTGTVNLASLITGTTGGTFSGPGVTGNNFDPVAAGVGTHSITYTVGNSPCQATSAQNVTVITDVDPSWNSPGAVCESSGTINLNTLITGTAGGTWSGTGVSGNTFNPLGLSGTNAVTYTVGSSPCAEVLTQNISVTTAVSAAWTTPGTICEAAGNVNLSALVTGTPGGTWSGTGVSGSAFNPTGLSGPIAITYSVGVTPCSDVQTFNITVTSDVNPAWASPGAVCEAAGTINLTTLLTGTAGGTWSGQGVSGNIFNPSGLSGNISVTYTVGTSPCVETSTQTIAVTSTVSAEWTTPGTICEAAGNINLNPLVTGNPGGTWSGTGVTGTTFNPTGLTGPVALTYSVGVTPCSDTKTYNITVVQDVDPSWDAPTNICEVQGVTDLTALLTGTTGGIWSGTGVTGNNFDPTGLTGQSVSITYTVGTAPCVETEVHSISITNVSAAWAAPDSICESDGVLSLNTLVSGTAGGTWSGQGVAGSSFNPVGLAGLVSVTYTVGTAPCVDSLTIEIAVKASPEDPAVTATKEEICFGEETIINASGLGASGYNVYSAATGGNLLGTTPLIVSPTSTTTYYVESESVSGCINLGGREPITVTVHELPDANAGPDQTICSGSSTQLTATGGDVYVWNTGANIETIFVTPQDGTWYSVSVTDDNGCVQADSAFVDVFFPGTITAVNDSATGENQTAISIDVVDNDSQTGGVVHVITQPEHGTADVDTDNMISYTPDGDYDGLDSIQYAICDSFCGDFCDTAWVYIDVLTFFIPSGISPNDDGVNDNFEIVGLFKFPSHHLQIFNRWGDLIYDAEPYLNDWHGQTNKGMVLGGDGVVEGTYFYIFYPNDGETETKKGTIELRKQ